MIVDDRDAADAVAAAAATTARPFDIEGDAYRTYMDGVLRRTFFSKQPDSYFGGPTWDDALTEHTHRRYIRFADHIVPWVQNVFDLKGAVVVEVGPGTGSSTLAFAPYVDRIVSYEIDPESIGAAKARLDHFGVTNVSVEECLFDQDCAFAKSGQQADVVLFIAVLEHMTFAELEDSLKLAWEVLRPGGILVVAETPNRLSPTDYHTSWLTFFNWLPTEVKLRYLQHSPRTDFLDTLQRTPESERPMSLVRWGRGISYHEFEIVFGAGVHNWIVADGHEEILKPIAPRFVDDDLVEGMFRELKLGVNRAFTRWFLYFVMQKPAA